MMGKSHLVMGFVSAAACSGILLFLDSSAMPFDAHNVVLSVKEFLFANGNVPFPLYAVCCSTLYLLGNLMPDMDSEKSILGRIIYIPVKHRTWLHSIYFPLLFLILGIWNRLVFWIGLGILVHLFWDSFSNYGIDWFYPKRNWKHLGFYDSGEPSEYVFGTVMGMLCMVLFGLGVWFRFFC